MTRTSLEEVLARALQPELERAGWDLSLGSISAVLEALDFHRRATETTCTDPGWEIRDGLMTCKNCGKTASDVFAMSEQADPCVSHLALKEWDRMFDAWVKHQAGLPSDVPLWPNPDWSQDVAMIAHALAGSRIETPADPELTRLGLPQSWNRACAYALTVVPNGMDDTDHEAGGRYMTVRNAYIAGAEGDDEFRQKPIELRGAAKTAASTPPTSKNVSDASVKCHECGMWLHDDCEYHPFAACLMFKACHDRDAVLANLNAVLDKGKESAQDETTVGHCLGCTDSDPRKCRSVDFPNMCRCDCHSHQKTGEDRA